MGKKAKENTQQLKGRDNFCQVALGWDEGDLDEAEVEGRCPQEAISIFEA